MIEDKLHLLHQDMSAAEIHKIVDESNDAIVISDESGSHLFVNSRACLLTGYSREELIRIGMQGLLNQDSVPELEERLRKRFASQEISPLAETTIIRKDGTPLRIEFRGLISSWQGTPADIVFFRDISHRKRRELRNDCKAILQNQFRRIFDIRLSLIQASRLIQQAELFERVVITLHDAEARITSYGFAGIDREIVEKAVTAPPPSPELRARMQDPAFRISNSYFIPVESGLNLPQQERYIPPTKKTDQTNQDNTWREGDEFFIPIHAENGSIEGYISVDTPHDGQRPDRETILFLEDLADLISRQIHDIRRVETLVESEQKFRCITEQSVLPISIFGHGRFIYVNKAFSDLFEYPAEEILGWTDKDIRRMADADILPQLAWLLAPVALSGSDPLSLVRGKTSKGRLLWIECFRKTIFYDGIPSELIILLDRTREKEIEEALQSSEEKSRALLEATEDAALLIDRSGNILELNSTCARRFFKSKEEMIGTCIWDYFLPEVARLRRESVEKAIRTRQKLHMEDEREGMHNSTNIYPILDSRGEVSRIAIFARDITNEKNLNHQLFNAEKLATVGRLSASIAHQIRNPLGNISFAAQLCLRQQQLPEEIKEYLQIILQDVNNANNIITNLLEFSKPRTLTLEKGDILEVIEEACQFVQPVCLNNNITVKKIIPSRLPQINLDKKWLIQAFINFLTNAIQAMEEGGVITIELKHNQVSKLLEIYFTDNGPGIPQQHLEHIFEPFFTTRDSGIGLGLNIVQKIIEGHHGTIQVYSTPGRSTTIQVNLPAGARPAFSHNLLVLPL